MINTIPELNTKNPFQGRSLMYTEMIIHINNELFDVWSKHAQFFPEKDSFIKETMMLISLMDQNADMYFLGQYIQHVENKTLLKDRIVSPSKEGFEDLRVFSECLETARKVKEIFNKMKDKYRLFLEERPFNRELEEFFKTNNKINNSMFPGTNEYNKNKSYDASKSYYKYTPTPVPTWDHVYSEPLTAIDNKFLDSSIEESRQKEKKK